MKKIIILILLSIIIQFCSSISNYKFQHLINLKNKKRTGIIIIIIINRFNDLV